MKSIFPSNQFPFYKQKISDAKNAIMMMQASHNLPFPTSSSLLVNKFLLSSTQFHFTFGHFYNLSFGIESSKGRGHGKVKGGLGLGSFLFFWK